ncbi:MAG: MerR family transcriptional regulator [Caulobacteraceae bacterium]|nr:MAG: MerR family transcriptional regulator [Caulobacteraceae bacterium]
MSDPIRYFSPAEAALRLGVSAKALRLYEQRGLVAPVRSEAGWRAYGPDQMARAGEVASLRALGFSLAQVARVLSGQADGLEPALAAHQAVLEARLRDLAAQTDQLRDLRGRLARGAAPSLADLTRLARPAGEIAAAFDLPWPWGGERFELRGLKPLTWIIGPLGSGKTRLAIRLAETLPGAVFLGLDRLPGRLDARGDAALAWLLEEGATPCDALIALLAPLTAEEPGALVIDLIEHGLDQATQEALAAWLRHRPAARPVLAMTRSSAMLDLAAVGPSEAILLCPANHSPPMPVAPHPGAPGYEAVATCLASPEVRARTKGLRAVIAA